MRLVDWIRRHPLVSYFVLTFAISWGLLLAVILPTTGILLPPIGEGAAPPFDRGVMPAALAAMFFGPTIASLIMTSLVGGRGGLRDLGSRLARARVPARYWAALLIAPGALLLVLAPLSAFDPVYRPGILTAPLPAIVGGLVAALAVGVFEEIGWTGFATPRLIERFGAIRGAILLGVLWTAWHLLATFWGSARSFGVLYLPGLVQAVVFLTSFRVIMTVIYQRTGSVLLAQLLHFTLTASTFLLVPATSVEQSMMWNSLWSLALAIAAVLVVGVRLPAIRHPRPA